MKRCFDCLVNLVRRFTNYFLWSTEPLDVVAPGPEPVDKVRQVMDAVLYRPVPLDVVRMTAKNLYLPVPSAAELREHGAWSVLVKMETEDGMGRMVRMWTW